MGLEEVLCQASSSLLLVCAEERFDAKNGRLLFHDPDREPHPIFVQEKESAPSLTRSDCSSRSIEEGNFPSEPLFVGRARDWNRDGRISDGRISDGRR